MAKGKKQEVNIELDEKLAELERFFGRGTMVKASDKKQEEVKEWVSTGSLTLDMATGGRGIPKGGKCTCIIGKESASKTTLALHIIAEDQKKGETCCFLDAENTLDLEYAEAIGVDLDKLHIVDREKYLKILGITDRQMITGEEWLDLAGKVISSNLYGTVVLDSIASLIPAAEIQTGLSGGRLAGVASMMAKAYRYINGSLSSSRSAFVYLNQYRMNPTGYNPLTEPGGEAWKYLQALKIDISKSLDKDDDGTYGIYVKGKISKSKVCIPYKKFQYYVQFGSGISRVQEIVEVAEEMGFITRKGGWYTVDGSQIQGIEKVKQFFLDNPEYMNSIENQIVTANEKTNA